MSIAEDMVRNVLETRFESIDKETVAQAKIRIIDVVGCILAGANASGCPAVVSLVRDWGGSEESTILVHGVKAPAHNVALANTIMARSYDYEPVEPYVAGRGIPGHISGTTVPTAITVAEQKATSGRELITALILGDDLTARIIAASSFSFDLGWDTTGTANMLGATAIASRLWKLNEREMLNAFGIVLNQMAGSFQNIEDAVHCFKLPQGLASRAGIISTELASRGFTGVKDPLLSKHGYFGLYCREHNPKDLTKDLGKKFYADSVLKPYPACRFTHAPIDCALQIARSHDIKPEDISAIKLNVTPASYNSFVAQPFIIGDVPQINGAFSLRYTVTNALLRKSAKPEHFTEEFIRDPKIAELVRKVELAGTMPPEKMGAAELTVQMKNGEKYSTRVDVARGDTIDNPITKQEIIEKFRNNVSFSKTVSEENAEKALNMLERLEEIDDVGEITDLLVRV